MLIDRLIQPASSFAGDIDGLFLTITVIVGFWFFATEAMFFYLLWKFRYKEGVRSQYITGKEKHLKKWVNIPHMLIIACDVVLIIGAIQVWYKVKQNLPEPDKEVNVISQQWAWTFEHPGADGELGTDDDIATGSELHVVVNEVYHWHLSSTDVLHSFSIPTFRFKQDAVPGRVITGWFEATEVGTFDIQCAEMCGIGHGIMGAVVVVETPEEHQKWIESQSALAKK